MSNVISLLCNLNWIPHSFNAWQAPNGDMWTLTDASVAPHIIAHKLIRAQSKQDLKLAAKHYDGKGLECGVEWFSTLSLIRASKTDELYALKSAIETVMCGATWPNERVASCHPEVDPICCRCGKARDTSLHSFWLCPANATIEDAAVVESQYLIPAAQNKSAEYPCLWLRGILPENFTRFSDDDSPRLDVITHQTNPMNESWNSGVYYGDASGGRFSSFPQLRRIGCGLVQVDVAGSLIWGRRFNLPGPVQTVPRGELFVLLYLLEKVEALSNITYVTDNKKVKDKFCEGEESALKSTNCDLFKEVFQHIHSKQLQVTVRWMPSHLNEREEQRFPLGITRTDILANALADREAGEAARSHEISQNIAASFIYYYGLTRKIQRRCAAIICSLPNRLKTRVPKNLFSPQPVSVDSLLHNSSHFVFVDNRNKIRCARCLDCMPASGSRVRQWLKSECANFKVDEIRPVPLKAEIVQLGNRSSHPTHQIFHFKGLIFCNKCGYRGPQKLVGLFRPCKPPSQQGKQNLKDLAAGRLPYGLSQWPAAEFNTPQDVLVASLVQGASITKATPEDVKGLRSFAQDFTQYKISQEDQPTHAQVTAAAQAPTQAPTIIPHRFSCAGFDDSESDSSSD